MIIPERNLQQIFNLYAAICSLEDVMDELSKHHFYMHSFKHKGNLFKKEIKRLLDNFAEADYKLTNMDGSHIMAQRKKIISNAISIMEEEDNIPNFASLVESFKNNEVMVVDEKSIEMIKTIKPESVKTIKDETNN